MRMKKRSMKRSMKKRAQKKSRKMKKRVSKVQKGRGRMARVFAGKKEKTGGGLRKQDLVRNKRGKVVSKKQSAASKNSKGGKILAKWGKATKQQRKNLKITGFCPVGGKTQKGQQLLREVRRLL